MGDKEIMPLEFYKSKIQKAIASMKHYNAGTQQYHDRLATIGILIVGAHNDGYSITITIPNDQAEESEV